jgi:hypothetical protein
MLTSRCLSAATAQYSHTPKFQAIDKDRVRRVERTAAATFLANALLFVWRLRSSAKRVAFQGHGRAVAVTEAWNMDCHHVLLQGGRADPRAHRFYEQCGSKHGFVPPTWRTGLPAVGCLREKNIL